ncbi:MULTISPECIES: histidine phosphatase family protein [unclassified Curtobacterium]|uniref:histidine phosphatase family protein n=1 Tax=unclassified Curtobacterium TaxID=257496 RepID=UPI00203C2988|nr:MULTISPECIES: histidine phosphatase family protein [unclassified Curtobacterium]MCM3522595.1 histidine phosphatase family protein [Curtobacterium sp. P97]MDT0210055.1 histidine phosphatase family protein [Curtobacterium sp. BRD11]
MSQRLLYLTRHGEQDPARPDGGLSQRGREQAELLGQRLSGADIGRIYESPLTRAAETASIVSRHLPAAERRLSDLVRDRTPVPSVDRRREYPHRWLAWLDAVPADERDEDARALRQAFESLSIESDAGSTDLVVTHNFVIGWFVREVLDAPSWRWMALHHDNCAVTAIRWDADRGPSLVAFNDTGHLR